MLRACGHPLGKSRCAREYNPADNRDPGDQGFNGLDVHMVLAQGILKGMAAAPEPLGPLGIEGPAVDPTAVILGLDDQQRRPGLHQVIDLGQAATMVGQDHILQGLPFNKVGEPLGDPPLP